jgi:4-hydroxyphenylacetate 3-monooxygenase
MSSRFDELDGQLWLDDVFVPWERVFFVEPAAGQGGPSHQFERGIASWLFWRQLYCWFEKAEFTLGLAFACVDVMGLKNHGPSIEYIVDMLEIVQTVRTCLTAAEREPTRSVAGYAIPNNLHVASGSLAMARSRQRLTEILRIVPGSSLVMAPSDEDLANPDLGPGLNDSFGGGGYTGLQRSALLNLVWDNISSALDARESTFELHASGGELAWRGQLRGRFDRYNELANGVLKALSVEMPQIDLSSIRNQATVLRREVTAPPPAARSPN